jgi:AraC family ethanolamine operon transcriptional activator
VQTQVFEDFDAFAESIRDIDSKMLLRNPQQRTWSISSVDLDEIDVQVGQLGSGNIAQAQLRPDGYMLYLPLTNTVEYSANGSILERNSFAILEPGCEFCISTKVKHDWCVAFVPSYLVAQGGDPLESPLGSCCVTRPNREAADQFRAVVFEVMNVAFHWPEFETSLAAKRARAAVLQIASQVLRPSRTVEPNREGRPRVPRQKIIQHAMELLEQRASMPVNVGELATAAHVSERTLRTAFRDYFGVGPNRYLQLKQLHQVHRALLAADPEEESVAQILIEHGEWAFSRFASRYRKLFGVLPSETLRAKAP